MAFKMNGWGGWAKPPMEQGPNAGSMMTKKSAYKKDKVVKEADPAEKIVKKGGDLKGEIRKSKLRVRQGGKKRIETHLKKEGPAYGGGGETWSEYDKRAEGDLNAITKSQKAYEARMRKNNPNWKREDDDIWKKRQNQINKMVESSKRHDVDEKKIRLTTKTVDRIGGGTKEIDLMKDRNTGNKYKNIVKKSEDGKIESEKTVDKTRNRGVDSDDPKGTKKLKKMYDEEGNLIGVRGYSTKEKRQAARAEKKKLKREARATRRSLRDTKKLEKKKRKQEKKDNRRTSDDFA